MTAKTKLALLLAIFFWASAFVAIRACLESYSPEGLSLIRYLIASACMAVLYFRLPHRSKLKIIDILALMGIGIIGVGIYSVTLNIGEIKISSGMASFIISQSPLLTALFAIVFLREEVTWLRAIGFLIGLAGVTLIALGEKAEFTVDNSILYILIATIASALYSIFQKPYLKKCNAIEATSWIMWGGTLFLCIFWPELKKDFAHTNLKVNLIVIYLGIFPAAGAYLAWSYVLSEISASQAVSFLYFMPFLATLLGWLCLGENPAWLSLLGGMISIGGVWLVNHSYQFPKKPMQVDVAEG